MRGAFEDQGRVRPSSSLASMHPKLTALDAPPSASWAIGRHCGFGSSLPVAASILNELRAPAALGPKEHRGATMAVRAVSRECADKMSAQC